MAAVIMVPRFFGTRSGGRRLTPESAKRATTRFPTWLTVWGPAVAWAAVLFLLSELRGVPLRAAFAANDKLVHMALYSVLGAALGWAWFASHSSRRPSRPISHLFAIGLGLANGVVDEIHQAFVPNRVPSVGDWVADAVGIVVGYMLAIVLLKSIVSRSAKPARDVST